MAKIGQVEPRSLTLSGGGLQRKRSQSLADIQVQFVWISESFTEGTPGTPWFPKQGGPHDGFPAQKVLKNKVWGEWLWFRHDQVDCRYLASLIFLSNIASEKVDHHQEAQWKVIPSIQVKPNRRRQRERLLRARGGQRRRRRWRRGTRGEMWRRRGCCHHPKSKLANSAQPPSNQRWVLEMARTQKMVIGEWKLFTYCVLHLMEAVKKVVFFRT